MNAGTRDYAVDVLSRLISVPSLPGEEEPALDLAESLARDLGLETERVPYDPKLPADPEYVVKFSGADCAGRTNLVARWPRPGSGPKLILQAHVDTVPAGEGQEAMYTARLEGDVLHGRGACDDKGGVAAILAAIQVLRRRGARPAGPLEIQIVGGEETGGTGALDLVRKGCQGDLVVILECTRLKTHPANRGALWFSLQLEGRETHMGRAWEGVNAIDLLAEAVAMLRGYEQKLLAQSRGYPLFEDYEYPIQLCLGTVRGGTWPAMVCGQVTLEGGVGFLPNKSIPVMQQELRDLFAGANDEWLARHHRLEFNGNRNEAYACDPNHPLIQGFYRQVRRHHPPAELVGMNISCDARLYARLAGIPTIVFGPGDPRHAHSPEEQLDVKELVTAAEILADFLEKPTG